MNSLSSGVLSSTLMSTRVPHRMAIGAECGVLACFAERPQGSIPPALGSGHVRVSEWVTKWVSRHVIATRNQLDFDLLTTCKPRFWPKTAL